MPGLGVVGRRIRNDAMEVEQTALSCENDVIVLPFFTGLIGYIIALQTVA